MRILRVDVGQQKVSFEDLPEDWRVIGGSGLINKIMNNEVPPDADPLGAANKLIIAGGPLAGTLAPQLGRVSVGAKSPLTFGIKEANVGGPAAQKLDKLGIRALVLEGVPDNGKLYCLKISQDETALIPADAYRGLNNYALTEAIYKDHANKPALITIGVAGERKYKSATVAFTDMLNDPSRNAGRGGLGAVMGSKGIKAIIIDDKGAPSVELADKDAFRETVNCWVDIVRRNIVTGLFSTFGTPFVVGSNNAQGTMPTRNYTAGRHEDFQKITGEVIKKNVWQRGGKFHACMPGCVVQCSILYNDEDGKLLTAAYEYEAIAMLGTNLDITDPDAVGRLKHFCDDLGIDLIEIGSCLGVAADGGKMKMGDEKSAMGLLKEIEDGTEFGTILADGVVATAKALNIDRIPAVKGQAIPGHDPRAVKGIGVTYATSPMGADHTAGLTYRMPLSKKGQARNSLRFQVQAAVCDTFGYCINSLPGGNVYLYGFLADLMNARYGLSMTGDDVVEVGKQTLRDGLAYNERAEFSTLHEPLPDFVRTEALPPTNEVFDIDESELGTIWQQLDNFKEPKKLWEVRHPSMPPMLFGEGLIARLGMEAKKLKMTKAFLTAGPVMTRIGRAAEMQKLLGDSGVDSVLFSDLKPDPPIEEIDRAGEIYKKNKCDGIVAIGGGSSLDAAKAIAIRVSQPGRMREFDSMLGGAAKIRAPLPPVICIPTTSGTGSEINQYAVITDTENNIKFVIMSDRIIPSLAIVDPELCRSMPQGLTADSGIDALSHCVEAYVGMAIPYHPYYEALALYGVKLIGRSLRAAFKDGDDIAARRDMCMAAINGGIAFTKGLGIGHGIGHVLGEYYHISHGKAVAMGLLCFVRANKKACEKQFADLAWAIDGSNDLEKALTKLFKDLELTTRFRDFGIPEEDLEKIAFETSKDVPNLSGNPVPLKMPQLLEVIKEFY